MSTERELIDFKQIAKMLGGVHPEQVRKNLSKRRDFPQVFMIGALCKYDKREIADWIESQRQPSDRRRVKAETHAGAKAGA